MINPKLLSNLPANPGTIGNGGTIIVGTDDNIYVTIGDVGINGHNIRAQNVIRGPDPDGTSGRLRVTRG